MKKWLVSILLSILLLTASTSSEAQCSICTRTAEQMGEKPGKGMNAGVLYLAAAPLLIAGFIGYKWVKGNSGNQ